MNKTDGMATGPAQALPNIKQLLKQAAQEQMAGSLHKAAQVYQQILAQNPKEAQALFGLGQLMGSAGQFENAIDIINQAIAVDDKRSDFHGVLATFLQQSGRFEDALENAYKAMELDEKDSRPAALAAICLNQMNRTDEAIEVLKKALTSDSKNPRLNVTLANLERRKGQLDEAKSRIESVLSIRDIDSVLKREACHELGFTLDKLGEYDEAFNAFEQAGVEELQSPVAKHMLRNPWREHIQTFKNGFTNELLSKWKGESFNDNLPAPAFLVGFPRSGTTMTEQIMAAHPDVVTAEEKPLIKSVTDLLPEMAGNNGSMAEMLDQLSIDQIKQLRSRYWQDARSVIGVDLTNKVFVDKLPLNILAVGVINVLFPDAKVLVAIRDPRDVCLSCLMQHFQLNEAMIHFLSLSGTADFYSAVMGSWLELRDIVTFNFLEVRYEDTVTDLESQARKILDLLGATWHEDVLSFHEIAKKRNIATPSFAAVTEKVHTRATKRWKNYQRHLEPVMPQLEPFIKAFGYSE